MVQFENEKIAYNSVIVKMDNVLLKEAVTAFKEVRYGDKKPSNPPNEKDLTQELQENILVELESLLEYEDNLEKVLIGVNEEELNCSRFVELKLNHEMKDEFEHEVIVENISLVQEV